MVTQRARLSQRLQVHLNEHPGITAREAVYLLLRETGDSYSKREINSVLYEYSSTFRREGDAPPRWYLVRQPSESASWISQEARVVAGIELFPWQRDALNAWAARQFKGVVEAVTGTGKTRVGIAAAAIAAQTDFKVAIVVPSVDLQRQWADDVRALTPHLRVGLLGGGQTNSLSDHDVVIATVQTACRRWMVPEGRKALLIADECHRYGAPIFARALEDRCSVRLGLTATYERQDDGVGEHLDRYFEGICYSLDYGGALAQKIIAEFKIAIVQVDLRPDERLEYDELSARVGHARKTLIDDLGVDPEPFGSFIREVSTLCGSPDPNEWIPARQFISAFRKRRDLLAGAGGKIDALTSMAAAIQEAERTITFTETIDAASRVTAALSERGIKAYALSSELNRDVRSAVLKLFELGAIRALAAPKLLDEGIDVPAADLAVILAASRSRLQMVQRMGRVLRKKPDGRLARLAILSMRGTSEDPAHGGHESFLDLVIPHARDVKYFSPNQGRALCGYLNDW